MKNLSIILLLFLVGCGASEDCFKSSGTTVSKNFDVGEFNQVIVNYGISLVLKQAPDFSVVVTSGENIIDNIKIENIDGRLNLSDGTTCNLTRKYGETIVTITAPNLTDIYCKTEKNIISDGILSFPNLRLLSMDTYDGVAGIGTGDYILNLDCENLKIETNTISTFNLSGKTENLDIKYYDGNGLFNSSELEATSVILYHRGSNRIVIHPIENLSGDIFSIGDVISTNRPPNVNVIQHYTGKLIFQ